MLYICALSQFSRLSLCSPPPLLHPLFSLTVFSPCSFAFWPLLLVADWDRICCQRWEDKTDLYHKRETQHILNKNIKTPWWAFTYTARWHTKPLYKNIYISPWRCFIFFVSFCFLPFFDCIPPSYFLCEDTRLELGDWGIWGIPLAGWGGLKKTAGDRERKCFRLLARGGRAGQRHSWSWPEVKGVLKKINSESSFNYLFLPVMTHSGRQYPQARTRKVFTLHKLKRSP